MSIRHLFATVVIMCASLVANAWARATVKVPAAVILRDSYEGFSATFVSARHGRFDVSIGESHEGDPGFGGCEKGGQADCAIVIYHMEPNRKGLPYVTQTVDVATVRQGVSVKPCFSGTRKIVYKGLVFLITPKNLSNVYGEGKTSIEVRATEP